MYEREVILVEEKRAETWTKMYDEFRVVHSLTPYFHSLVKIYQGNDDD